MFIENNGSEASALDGLQDPGLKDPATKEILEEIGKEEKNTDPNAPKADAPKPEGDNKPKDGEKDKKPEEKPRVEPPAPRKPVKLMPAYVHEIALGNKDKEIGELKQLVETLKQGKSPESKVDAPNEQQQASLEQEVKKLAETHNLAPELVKSLVELGMKFGGKIPDAITQKLAAVDDLKAAAEVQAEEAAYNAAFDEQVVPLIKKEYGDNVGQDTIQAIREQLKGLAYSKEYAQTPYAVIFKGIDEFRGYTRPAAASAEASRGGTEGAGKGQEGDATEFANVTDADIDKMDPATFDRYSAWAQTNEKNRR